MYSPAICYKFNEYMISLGLGLSYSYYTCMRSCPYSNCEGCTALHSSEGGAWLDAGSYHVSRLVAGGAGPTLQLFMELVFCLLSCQGDLAPVFL